LLKRLIEEAKTFNVPTLVDPKGRDFSKYSGATMITPNRKEAFEACIDAVATVDEAGELLLKRHMFSAVLITQGENGMTLFEAGRRPRNLSARARHVYDVTGAGDTVIATLAAGISVGLSFEEAAELANIAAGFVVEEVGTTVITSEKLKSEVDAF
jgi:D-beta-D-heptose 7-phosphate kinase/D-beta-D-heptose 1-phosphate adenosyltransferase